MATGLFNLKQVNQAISQGAWSGYIAPRWVEYLVVAGGGGGATSNGSNITGGGGAGGLLTGIVTVAAGTSYTVTLGGGGGAGTNGSSSVFGSITTNGGGSSTTSNPSNSGGSGGGGTTSASNYTGGQGISGQGNAGGTTTGSTTCASGGGGAGTVGINGVGSSTAGNGGAGIASAISGTVVTYAGGGGGGSRSDFPAGAGGVGGGGAGALGNNVTATSGGGNTGGGGGGNGQLVGVGTGGTGGSGGSGIVVVRYPGNVQFYTGGTVTYSNGYIVHNFTANGTLAPTTPTIVSEYQISRSLRFNSTDSTYLNRTPASASNRKTWTWSGWVKRSQLGAYQRILEAGSSTADRTVIGFDNADKLEFFNTIGGSVDILTTTQVLRDASAWYHIVVAMDTTQATASDRTKIYLNGVQITSFTTANYESQNFDTYVNSTIIHRIGANQANGDVLNGYMTEINFIDGQALPPTSFGYVNPATGVWSPAKFIGAYGTNGFYVNFSDNSNTTAATLGADYSGNGNNWTPNNFSVTAGAGNDSLVDSPTSYGTDTGVGGTVRGNYSTWNPLTFYSTGTIPTFTNGNLDVSVPASAGLPVALGTFVMPSGQWYWEVTITSGGAQMVGIANSTAGGANSGYTTANGWYYYSGGQKYNNNVDVAYGTSFTVGDVIGVALDIDAGTLVFYKNGASQGTAYSTGLTGKTFVAALGNGASSTAQGYTGNFGQRAFANTAPSGFKALCTQNLPTPTIGATSATVAGKFFAPVLYTGTGASRAVSGVGFQPDWVWIKSTSNAAYNHRLVDAVRGVTKELYSSLTNAEGTDTNGLTAFDANGFTLGSSNEYNISGGTFVSWNWKANGSGSTNTAGSITSTVSANTTSGFSIVKFAVPGSGSLTVGHGLGAVPSVIIVKGIGTSDNWATYVSSVCTTVNLYLRLNTTESLLTASGIWGSALPTSSVFGVTAGTTVNASQNVIAYCFAPIAGYSAFGSYTGNGSADGPFIYTGFRPAYVMGKKSSGIEIWYIIDAARGPYNVNKPYLAANTSGIGSSAYSVMDFTSNGFKLRDTDTTWNANGDTYIFMAFAENPFKYSLAR
jgi:hypothetical protein